MKKNILFLSLCILFVLNACGPAAENRDVMKARSKVFQDSIAFIIKSSMDEAAAPGPNQVAMPADTSRKNMAPGTNTVK